MVSDTIEVLGWALLHFVWQGGVAGIVAAILLAALRRRSANARYLTAVTALSVMLLLPVLTIAWIKPASPPDEVAPIFLSKSTIEVPPMRDDGTPALDEPPIKAERIGIDFENPPPPDAEPLLPLAARQALLEELSEQQAASKAESILKPFIPWAVAAWLTGVGVLSLRLFGSWWSVQRLRRRATQPADASWQALLVPLKDRLRVARPVKLVESALVEVPAVIGWLRPVILLPATAMTGLTTEQLEALLAHELAHVRRHDYLVNLLQTIVETLLFYHPAVWWISHRIRVEREHCCDDLAVRACGNRVEYARALIAMEELRAQKLTLALSSRGGSLLTRVARLLDPIDTQQPPVGWIAGFFGLLMLAVASALGAGLATPPETSPEGLSGPRDQSPRGKESKRGELRSEEVLKSGDPHQPQSKNLGRFIGRVRLKTEKPLPDLAKVEVPAGNVLDESLVFSKEGGLANVFVYLRKPTFPIEPATEAEVAKPFVLIAEDGKFWPHAALVRVERPLVFENRDVDAINFRVQASLNESVNVLVPADSRHKVPRFERSEFIAVPVQSDVKYWMRAYLLRLDHPFAAVTDDDGKFRIDGLPPGEHRFRVWHERVGWLEQSLAITIKAGEEVTSKLEYPPTRFWLTEAEVLSWPNRQINATRNPVRRQVPPPEVQAQPEPKAEPATLPAHSPESLKAVERGIAFLKAQQQEDGTWKGTPPDGVTALCAAALLQAGVKPDDPVIQKTLTHLRKVEPMQTFVVALQTMVFCSASPKQDAELIKRNVAWLEKAQVTDGKARGAWSCVVNPQGRGDGSCSRFAVLGLHAAKKAGFDVQAETWQRVSDYWLTTQRDQNGWGYTAASGVTPTMTLAGVACLATANRNLPKDEQTKVREAAMLKPAEYLEARIPELPKGNFAYYALHCLERAGHVSGIAQFGKLDWKSETTKPLLET